MIANSNGYYGGYYRGGDYYGGPYYGDPYSDPYYGDRHMSIRITTTGTSCRPLLRQWVSLKPALSPMLAQGSRFR